MRVIQSSGFMMVASLMSSSHLEGFRCVSGDEAELRAKRAFACQPRIRWDCVLTTILRLALGRAEPRGGSSLDAVAALIDWAEVDCTPNWCAAAWIGPCSRRPRVSFISAESWFAPERWWTPP